MSKTDMIRRLEESIRGTLTVAELAATYGDYKVVLLGYGEYTILRSLLEDLGVEYIDATGKAQHLTEIVADLKVVA